jgi:4-amino-4-deoxy-L-arabinose transferase-like glycosyltransferase
MMSGVYGEVAERASAFWPPLYPYMLAGIYSTLGYSPEAVRMLQAGLGAVLPLTLFLAARRLVTLRTARLASLGAAVFPFFIVFGAWLIAESLFFALSGVVLWISAELQHRQRLSKAILLGGALGLAALAKPTILMQIPFLALWFFTSLKQPLRWRFLSAAIALFTFVLIVSPWTARNYAALGRFVPISTNGGYTFYGANNANAFGGHYEHFPTRDFSLNEADEQSMFYQQGLSWILENPQPFIRLTGEKFRRLISPLSVASSPQDMQVPFANSVYVGYGAFLLLAAAGIVLSLSLWRQFMLLYVPILGVVVSTFIFYGDARYLLPAIPSILVFACLVVDQGLTRLSHRVTRG